MVTAKKSSDAPATKKDLEKFATKKDLQELRAELKIEFKEGLTSLKNELTDKILTSQDEIIKKLDDMRTEKLMLISRNREHTETINNHEERIVRLERKVLV